MATLAIGRARVAASPPSSSSSSRVARARASRVAAKASAETRRFGIGRGSSATYRERAPTTYEDGVADSLAIALFNAKLRAVVGEGDEEERALRGFDRLVALSERLAEGRDVEAQRDAVTRALLSIIPAPVRYLFKKLIAPATWVDEMNAVVTREAFAWLVGPCEVVPRESDGAMASVKLHKCRYLEQSGCTASCANFCKVPTQRFFKEAFGVDARLDPNHEDGSCLMTFGAKPDAVDAAFAAPCYETCAKGCKSAANAPCHRLGSQPER